MDHHSRDAKKNTSHGHEVLPKDSACGEVFCSIGVLVASSTMMTDVDQNDILMQNGSVYDMDGVTCCGQDSCVDLPGVAIHLHSYNRTGESEVKDAYKDHVTNEEVRAKTKRAIIPHEDFLTIVKRRKL